MTNHMEIEVIEGNRIVLRFMEEKVYVLTRSEMGDIYNTLLDVYCAEDQRRDKEDELHS